MLRGLAPCLLLLCALPGAPAGGFESEFLEEAVAAQPERRPARREVRLARREPAPVRPSVRREIPPTVAVDRVGPRVARRTVRPPTGA